MLKLTKKADYGLMAMKHLAEHAPEGSCSAKDVADAYGIPQEALAKILQRLVKAGFLKASMPAEPPAAVRTSCPSFLTVCARPSRMVSLSSMIRIVGIPR